MSRDVANGFCRNWLKFNRFGLPSASGVLPAELVYIAFWMTSFQL